MFNVVVLKSKEQEETGQDFWGSKRRGVSKIRGHFVSVPISEK